jgi:hypothetical protein
LPAVAWRGLLLCGFERDTRGEVVELDENCHFIEALRGCHPELGLAELARLTGRIEAARPDLWREIQMQLFSAYGLRRSERLAETLTALRRTPISFQAWVDEKKLAPRELAPLLALEQPETFDRFLNALAELMPSRQDGARALELGVELHLLGRPLSDLLPSSGEIATFLPKLESWRRPLSSGRDEVRRGQVARWPWPSQVEGQWRRFGDECGLEIKIRTTSPQDFLKKLERLDAIRETWSCGN